MSDHGGKGYTPLPQSISNSDTDDEEDCLSQSNEPPKTNIDDTLPVSSTTYVFNYIRRTKQPTTIHENGVYYPLDETRNLANRTKNGQNILKYYRDDMPIMVVEDNDLWKKHDMSPLRRFCLIASVLLCISTIIIFLYILPCDNSMVCPSINEPRPFISWDKILQGIEINGPISIIHGNPSNLIFLVRGQRYKGNDTNDEQRQISAEGGGVMSMQGNSGLPLWLVSLNRQPGEIDCITIDTDRSGNPDCIVVGDQGLLASIEPIAGTIHWSSKFHTFEKLPLILSDIDSDGVEDLLSIEVVSKKMANFILLSGGTGHLLGRYSPENCSSIDIYNHISNDSISYICQDNNRKSIIKTMTIRGLLHAIILPEAYKQSIAKSTITIRMFQTLKFDNDKYNWRPTPYHYLSIKNEGTCPGEFCRASVNLTLQKIGVEPVTIWEHTSSNSFISKPAFLVVSGKSYSTEFAIKVWQWINLVSENTKKMSIVTERRLIERVLIVFVNYTDVQVMNANQSDIVQLCRDTNCQPDLTSRVYFNSIKIDNINDDEFPELITYWSSYDVESLKVLTSKVQVVKLDSLLSNLSHMGI